MKSLTEILNLPGNIEIPRDIEDVTLHVIEKIAKSNNSTELKSGGPWVRFFFTLSKPSNQSTSLHVPFNAPPKYVRKPGPN